MGSHTETTPQQTRERLIEAAAAVFAEQGYRSATIREISHRAGANLAAVNYHFRDKEGLYLEVLRSVLRAAYEKFPVTLGLSESASSEELLNAFVKSLLLRIFDADGQLHLGRLMLNEMVEPTGALDELVKQEMAPKLESLALIVQRLAGGRLGERELRRVCYSIVGQCVFYKHCWPMIERLEKTVPYDREELERLAEHITRFSLLGLKNVAPNATPRMP